MAERFIQKVCPIFAPSLHRYFAVRFAEPAAWLAARTRYARSHAVWCVVGHVVGLGDRHGENILLDEAGWYPSRGGAAQRRIPVLLSPLAVTTHRRASP